MFSDISKKREDFTFLRENTDYIYADNACVTLKPDCVIAKMNEYYHSFPACHGRSNHRISEKLTAEVVKARERVRKFIGAKAVEEIIFLRNTTEGINLVAQSLDLKFENVVLTTDKEHNSNLIPWLRLVDTKKIIHDVIETNDEGVLTLDSVQASVEKYESDGKTVKVISINHVSNVDGVENPIAEIVSYAHSKKILVVVDGAQGAPHIDCSVSKLGVDFYAFSGHKLCGPSGTGVLYGRKELLEKLPQYTVGGETVSSSTYDSYVVETLPEKFEGGLQDYAGIIGLGEACTYIRSIGRSNIHKQEVKLNVHLTELLHEEIERGDIVLLGPKDAKRRGGIFNFYVPGMNHNEISLLLDKSYSVAVRSGTHCVHSWFADRKIEGSVRVALYFYNTMEEVEAIASAIREVVSMKP
jgi:cysteine desulfurase/selenocysteine lyase